MDDFKKNLTRKWFLQGNISLLTELLEKVAEREVNVAMFIGEYSLIDVFATNEFMNNIDEDTDSNWDSYLTGDYKEDYFFSQVKTMV